MKVLQSWKRNPATTGLGESITLTILFSSCDPAEIDALEEKLSPPGVVMLSDDDERGSENA